MGAAIRTILIADLVMSLDNVIAVAAAAEPRARGLSAALLIIGLATSIPLIIVGSTLLMKMMERFPIIITLGAALLGWLAGEMFVTDPAIVGVVQGQPARTPDAASFGIGWRAASVGRPIGKWLQAQPRPAAPSAEAQPMHNSVRIERIASPHRPCR